GANTISGNTVVTLSNSAPTITTGVSAAVIGISETSATASQVISTNTIYGLTNNAVSAASIVEGILYSGPTTGTNSIDGNFVHSFSDASTSVTAESQGINLLAGTATVSNN